MEQWEDPELHNPAGTGFYGILLNGEIAENRLYSGPMQSIPAPNGVSDLLNAGFARRDERGAYNFRAERDGKGRTKAAYPGRRREWIA